MRAAGIIVLTAIFVAGCSEGVSQLPVHRGLNGGPLALLEAELTSTGGCVYASRHQEPAGRWLLVWPPGFVLDGMVIRDALGDSRANLGDEVTLTGGEYHASQYEFLQTLLTTEIPDGCRSDEYWLVTDLGPNT